MGRYIDPRTDFGFKRLFGQEDSKDILKQFLFDILALPHPIAELDYIPGEQLPATANERPGVYDVYCMDTMGRRFIVEMQQAKQSNIKERAVYYSTFAIAYQAQRGTISLRPSRRVAGSISRRPPGGKMRDCPLYGGAQF